MGERILQEVGLKNVTQEKFFLKRWTAQNVMVQIVQPGSQSLVSTLLVGSLISGPVEGTMAYFPTYTAFLVSPPGESRDKIVVIRQELRRTADGSDYVEMVPERSKQWRTFGQAGFRPNANARSKITRWIGWRDADQLTEAE